METFSATMKMEIMKNDPPVGEESLKAGMGMHALIRVLHFPRNNVRKRLL